MHLGSTPLLCPENVGTPDLYIYVIFITDHMHVNCNVHKQ